MKIELVKTHEISVAKSEFLIEEKPGVSLSFYPYLGPITEPDHFLVGFEKNVLTVCFHALKNSTERNDLECQIRIGLRENE